VWCQREVQLPRMSKGCHSITQHVVKAMPEIAQVEIGLLHVFLQHTSASLTINENADPDVLADLEEVMSRVVPEDWPYDHSYEGPDDMPSHAKSSLLGASLLLPVRAGRLSLGTWQGICLFEHRRRGPRRRLILTLQGQPRDQDQAGEAAR